MSLDQNTKKVIFIMLLFNILFAISFFALTNETARTHEMAHKEIAQNYGCVDYDIRHNIWAASAEFECLEYNTNTTQWQEQYLHSVNEIVGYNISSIMSALAIVGVTIMNVLFFIRISNGQDKN